MKGRRALNRVCRPVSAPDKLDLEYVHFDGDEEKEFGVAAGADQRDKDSEWNDKAQQRQIDAQAAVVEAEEFDQEENKSTE